MNACAKEGTVMNACANEIPSAAKEPVMPFRADWRVYKDYPRPSQKGFNHWAWEFLRRNARYCEDAEKLRSMPEKYWGKRQPTTKDRLKYLICDPPPPKKLRNRAGKMDEYKEWSKRKHQRKVNVQTPNQALRLRWGITYPLLPSEKFKSIQKVGESGKRRSRFLSSAISFLAPSWLKSDLATQKKIDVKTLAANCEAVDAKVQGNLHNLFKNDEVKTGTFSLYPHEVYIKFRLNESLPTQLQKNQGHLEAWQGRYWKAINNISAIPYSTAPVPQQHQNLEIKEQKTIKVHDSNLHYMLRIYDAVKDPKNKEQDLTDALLAEITKQFNSEKKSFSSDNKLEAFFGKKFPTLSAKQVKDWFVQARYYVEEQGYLAIASRPKNKVFRDKKARKNAEEYAKNAEAERLMIMATAKARKLQEESDELWPSTVSGSA
jgi:hypothetical protein